VKLHQYRKLCEYKYGACRAPEDFRRLARICPRLPRLVRHLNAYAKKVLLENAFVASTLTVKAIDVIQNPIK
jgi:hypothetical protein